MWPRFEFLTVLKSGVLEMYAVIEQGSKQYKVAEGDYLNIELADVSPDAETIELDKVLLVSDGKEVKVGTPFLEGAKVIASFQTTAEEAVIKGKKLYPMYFRRRKNSKKRIGHRQKYLQVIIDKIQV
jgi:large subunit ribosomal protein L21